MGRVVESISLALIHFLMFINLLLTPQGFIDTFDTPIDTDVSISTIFGNHSFNHIILITKIYV